MTICWQRRETRHARQIWPCAVKYLFSDCAGTSTNERIDHAHASVYEINTVSRGDRQTVDGRRRRDEAILNRHGFPGCTKTRQQFRPFQARVRVPGQTMETPGSRVEPAFQGCTLPSLGKDENPEAQFAEDDGIDGDVWLMCAK